MARRSGITFSRAFKLNKSQFELDFVDIYMNQDLPLFLDSAYISQGNDEWSKRATSTIRSFFDHLLSLISNNQIDRAKEIFINFEEPNETRLGVSKGSPRGRGVGSIKSEQIFKNIINSPAARSGLIEDLEDFYIFVDNFGPDNLSDMITNIIKKDLIEYTQEQAKLWNLNLTPNISSGQYWDITQNTWTQSHTDMLLYKDTRVILVPKYFVVRNSTFNPSYYHNYFVLQYLQQRNLSLLTPLVKKRIKKNGEESYSVSKKSIKDNSTIIHEENGYNICKSPGSKKDMAEFSLAYPQVYNEFKTEVLSTIINDSKKLEVPISKESIAKRLIDSLSEIEPGNDHASRFHNWSIGAFEFLFDGILKNPTKEYEIHDGRKRIDIKFSNYALSGIFHKLSALENYPCPYILIECKNYSREVANPELDQLAGRFSPRRGRLGIIHCRGVDNLELFIKRCRDTFLDDRGLIILLTDTELKEALNYIITNQGRSISQIIEKYIDEIRT